MNQKPRTRSSATTSKPGTGTRTALRKKTNSLTKYPIPTLVRRRILTKLERLHPNADTELHFSDPYQLLVATILSAQCTDKRVNQTTPSLFKQYPDAQTLAQATPAQLEPQIQSTGFFRSKARSLIAMASALVEHHDGQVPDNREKLVKLTGVGRKTANVVLGHAFGIPAFPVDRHVQRVSNRIGLARSSNPSVTEEQLCQLVRPTQWTQLSDTLILHGRRVCKPRPLCDHCPIQANCHFYNQLSAVT